jgi:hypothetical protein
MGRAWWSTLVAALCAALVAAQDADTTEIRRLKDQVEAITREIEELRLGKEVVVEADTSVGGFGPAASKVYKTPQGVSIGGYGEFLYENFSGTRQDDAPSDRTDRIDALRAIVYVGYKFSDKVLFNSEVEFEHGSTEDGGSVSVEFAYLDYRPRPELRPARRAAARADGLPQRDSRAAHLPGARRPRPSG